MVWPLPSAHRKGNRKSGNPRDDAPGHHTKKPDGDNVAKPILDALTLARIWPDDSIVSDPIVRKRYTSGQVGWITVCVDELEPIAPEPARFG